MAIHSSSEQPRKNEEGIVTSILWGPWNGGGFHLLSLFRCGRRKDLRSCLRGLIEMGVGNGDFRLSGRDNFFLSGLENDA